MDSSSSVTTWIEKVKEGDADSQQKLWERYCLELVELARKKLAGARRGLADEEDVVSTAFEAFFRAAGAGKLTLLHDRNDLWRLLVAITENKARDLRKHENRLKRGGGAIREQTPAATEGASTIVGGWLDQAQSPGPTPEFAAETVEEMRRLLKLLGDPQLEQIALLKMAGHTHEEIGNRLGCVPDTVGRKLRLIRSAWRREIAN